MVYYKIESLLMEYRDISVYLELFEGNDSVYVEGDLSIDELYLMKQKVLIDLANLLSLSKKLQEKVIIEKVEYYLMNFQ